MKLRDRIVELRRVQASELCANPRNWRTHTEQQRGALRDFLCDVGIADALLARVRDDGVLELIDGHLRADLLSDQVVSVLVLDVTQDEADKLLATIDPLTQMAGVSRQKLGDLLEMCGEQSGAVEELRKSMARRAGLGDDQQRTGDSFAVEVDVNAFRMTHRCKGCGLEFNAK